MSSENPLPSVQTKATPGPAPGGLGRGLFASTTVQTGEDVLHITSPFVAVLDTQRLGDTCAGCLGKRQLETGSSLKGCTGCQVVKYCDKVTFPFHDHICQYHSLIFISDMSSKRLEISSLARVPNLPESEASDSTK
jgi:hypothetical protein